MGAGVGVGVGFGVGVELGFMAGAGATGFKVTPVRRITATAFEPAVPLW
jgi:hypothetical protein